MNFFTCKNNFIYLQKNTRLCLLKTSFSFAISSSLIQAGQQAEYQPKPSIKLNQTFSFRLQWPCRKWCKCMLIRHNARDYAALHGTMCDTGNPLYVKILRSFISSVCGNCREIKNFKACFLLAKELVCHCFYTFGLLGNVIFNFDNVIKLR